VFDEEKVLAFVAEDVQKCSEEGKQHYKQHHSQQDGPEQPRVEANYNSTH